MKNSLIWWESDNKAQSIEACVNNLMAQLKPTQQQRRRNAEMYGDNVLWSYFHTAGLGSAIQTPRLQMNNNELNVVRSAIDALTAKVAKVKVRPAYLTDDGSWDEQQLAEELNNAVAATFYDVDFYTKARQVFRHACVFDTGCLKFVASPDNKSIQAEIVLVSELLVDQVEATSGQITQLHQVKYAPRATLLKLYPDQAKAINQAPSFSSPSSASASISDVIRVTESWKLNNTHVISIPNQVLAEESWPHDFFPFSFFKYQENLLGFYGVSVAQILQPYQFHINRVTHVINVSQELCAVPRVYIKNASNIVAEFINAEVGSIINHDGDVPSFNTATAQNPEMYQYQRYLTEKAFEQVGLSQSYIGGTKTPGVNAAVAIREVNDIQNDRQAAVALAWEQFAIDSAKVIVELGASQGIKRFKLAKSKANMDSLKLKVWPTNLLPDSPGGRLATVTEMIQAGMIKPDMAIDLLGFPDIDAFRSMVNASIELTKKQITKMLKTGNYIPPEPSQNLEQSFKMAQDAQLRAQIDDMPEDRIELLLRYQDDCNRLIEFAKSAQSPQEQIAPMAQPMAAPVSDLLPIA